MNGILQRIAWSVVLQLIVIESFLSIDNSAVIGAKTNHIAADALIPWPRGLGWMNSRLVKRLLGRQRSAVYRIGFVGAIVLRFMALFFVQLIATSVWVRFAGAAYLLIAFAKHFFEVIYEVDKKTGLVAAPFWRTVFSVIMYDLVFSIDNVVTAVALSNDLLVLYLGVGLGIITMWIAASQFSKLVQWEPWLEHGAYLLIGAIGIELLLRIAGLYDTPEMVQFGISVGLLVLTVVCARVIFLRNWLRYLGKLIRRDT